MYKFALGQVVFYIENNRTHSAAIFSRMCVENLHDDWACTKEEKATWQAFGESCVKYVTIHGTYLESQLFDSLVNLTDRLLLTHPDKDLY